LRGAFAQLAACIRQDKTRPFFFCCFLHLH
jgi:hypothetical protein